LNFRLRIPDWILLPAFCGFFFLWRLAAFGLIGADEPRYAQVAREMLARHDWVTPTLGGAPWLEKPPLYYWQAMAAYRIFGVSDWAARLPSVLDATLLVLAVYWFVRRFRGGVQLDGALMLTTAAGIVGYARAASTDMPLAATFGIAMLAWYGWLERRSRTLLTVAYAFLGLGMLAKGPVAPLLAAVIVAAFAGGQRKVSIIRESLSVPGMAAFAVVALPWYVLVQLRNPQFFHVFVLEHNLARFGTNMFHHPEPFWYYVPVTLLAWVPWVVLAIAAIGGAVRLGRDPEHDPLNSFLIVWIVVFVSFFSISESKLPGYILPAVPAGVVLLANFLRERRVGRLPGAVAVLHGLLVAGLVFAALISASVLRQHRFLWHGGMVAPLVAAMLIGFLFSIALLRGGYAGVRLAGLAPAIIVLAVVIRIDSGILNDTLSARSVSDALAAVSSQRLPVAVFLVPRELQFGLQFYRNQAIPRYELHQAPSGEHLVVARKGTEKAFARDVPDKKIVYLGSFPPRDVEFFYVSK
jgi:4-amino-4-deoxy-L-arabinose transferase-like glycosyltransferase